MNKHRANVLSASCDRATGHSSGFGFVEAGWIDGLKAMSGLNGTLK
ncbi:MAG TPA: hypothetical protein PKC69_12825 [Chitinophagaceae bacterium]|nr:hypothetical protein [Chitinophagaceae bacterium]